MKPNLVTAPTFGIWRIAGRADFQHPFAAVMPALLEAVPGLTVLHQSGMPHAERTHAAYVASGADPQRWQCARLSTTCQALCAGRPGNGAQRGFDGAELAAQGSPPCGALSAADNHQKRNAKRCQAARPSCCTSGTWMWPASF